MGYMKLILKLCGHLRLHLRLVASTTITVAEPYVYRRRYPAYTLGGHRRAVARRLRVYRLSHLSSTKLDYYVAAMYTDLCALKVAATLVSSVFTPLVATLIQLLPIVISKGPKQPCILCVSSSYTHIVAFFS